MSSPDTAPTLEEFTKDRYPKKTKLHSKFEAGTFEAAFGLIKGLKDQKPTGIHSTTRQSFQLEWDIFTKTVIVDVAEGGQAFTLFTANGEGQVTDFIDNASAEDARNFIETQLAGYISVTPTKTNAQQLNSSLWVW